MICDSKQNSFTLIEFVIYIGIVGVVLLVAGAIALNVFFGKEKLTAIEEVSQNARFSMEKIASTIRNADAVNSPAIGTAASAISLRMASSTLDPTIFDFSGGAVRIQQGLGPIINLTSNEITVTDVQFSNISYQGTPGTVRIQMTFKNNNPSGRQEYEFMKTFYATANVYKK